MSERDAYECLRKYGKHISRQERNTLKGQIRAGNIGGAMNGLDKILSRRGI